MDTQNLYKFIDKVVGKEGPLRVPAYWMREAFRSVIKWGSEIEKNCLQYINLSVKTLKLEVDSKYSKKPIKGTYFELLMLAKNGKLIPNQVYELTDYQATIGSLANKKYFTDVQAVATNTMPLKIFLTAKSISKFHNHVEGYFNIASYSSIKFEGDFIFDRYDDSFTPTEWCMLPGEGVVMKGRMGYYDEARGEEITLSFSRFDPSIDTHVGGGIAIVFTDDAGNEYVTWTDHGCTEMNYRNKTLLFRISRPDDNHYIHWTELNDPFKGCFYNFSIPSRNVSFPWDPLNISFIIDGVQRMSYDGYETNIHVSPVNKYFTCNSTDNSGLCYDSVQVLTGIVAHEDNVTVTGGSYNCCFVRALSHNEQPPMMRYDIHNSSNIITDSKVSGNYILDNCHNIRLTGANSGNTLILRNCFGSGNKYGVSSYNAVIEAVGISTGVTGGVSYKKINMALDSKGNVRTWNPADYVDTIDIEEE